MSQSTKYLNLLSSILGAASIAPNPVRKALTTVTRNEIKSVIASRNTMAKKFRIAA